LELENERIDYRVLSRRVMLAVEAHSKQIGEQNNTLFRKIRRLLQQRNVSLFEAFAFMDTN
jgi:hypothetical protein